jgi:hypothetical protein
MAILTGKPGRQGAIVKVKVMQSEGRVAALKKAGRPFETPIVIFGLIDTGASSSVLDYRIVSHMKPEFRGPVSVQTPTTGSGFLTRDSYDVTLAFGEGQPDPLTITVLAIEADLITQGFDALIGRDVLSRCMLTYDGPANGFSLRW